MRVTACSARSRARTAIVSNGAVAVGLRGWAHGRLRRYFGGVRSAPSSPITSQLRHLVLDDKCGERRVPPHPCASSGRPLPLIRCQTSRHRVGDISHPRPLAGSAARRRTLRTPALRVSARVNRGQHAVRPRHRFAARLSTQAARPSRCPQWQPLHAPPGLGVAPELERLRERRPRSSGLVRPTRAGVSRRLRPHLVVAKLETAPADARLCSRPILDASACAVASATHTRPMYRELGFAPNLCLDMTDQEEVNVSAGRKGGSVGGVGQEPPADVVELTSKLPSTSRRADRHRDHSTECVLPEEIVGSNTHVCDHSTL